MTKQQAAAEEQPDEKPEPTDPTQGSEIGAAPGEDPTAGTPHPDADRDPTRGAG